jgi:hypothetical protein
LSVLLQFESVSVLELTKSLGVFLLGLEEILVPLLVEFLILFDVGLLAIFSLLGLVEDELVVAALVILHLEL